MAYNLAQNVNEIHRQGFDQKGRMAGNFFKQGLQVRDYSEHIEVDADIQKDVGNVVCIRSNAPADNRIANVIAGCRI